MASISLALGQKLINRSLPAVKCSNPDRFSSFLHPCYQFRHSISFLRKNEGAFKSKTIKAPVISASKDEYFDKTVQINILVSHQVKFGDSIAVTGSADWLGSWSKPIDLTWSENGWKIELMAEKGVEIELKFIVLLQGKAQAWENGDNRKWRIPQESGIYDVVTQWDKTSETVEFKKREVLEKNKVEKVEQTVSKTSENQEKKRGKDEGKKAKKTEERSQQVETVENETTDFSRNWQGNEINFMKSNQHKRERNGVWKTEGLSGPILQIVEGDKGAGNWWRKV